MRRDTQAVLLVLLGGAILKISLTGTYVRYIKPGLLVLLVAGGVTLVAIAGVTLWQVVREQLPAGRSGAPPGAEVHRAPAVGWLLLAPALALVLLSPPAVGSFQAARSGTALPAQGGTDFAALPEGDPVRLTVLDYATRAIFDEGRSLAGRRVLLSGFVVAGSDGRAYLTRMIVTCCAADARPVKVGLTGNVPADLAADQWLEVEGSYTDRTERDPVNQNPIPFLQVAASRVIPAPDRPYE